MVTKVRVLPGPPTPFFSVFKLRERVWRRFGGTGLVVKLVNTADLGSVMWGFESPPGHLSGTIECGILQCAPRAIGAPGSIV
jgi:hypothetical protein